MSETPKCTSWLGHKFEARYSYGEIGGDLNLTAAEGGYISPSGLAKIHRSLASQTYECDVCVRCGHVVQPPIINVEAPPPPPHPTA